MNGDGEHPDRSRRGPATTRRERVSRPATDAAAADLRLSAPVFRVGGRTAIKWYMTDTAAVTVKLEQINHKGHHLPRGSFQLKGRPGSDAVLFKGRLPGKRP